MSDSFVKEYRDAVQILLLGFPDATFTIHELVAEGDRVVVRWRWKGRHTGTFRGIAPTGITVENDGIVIYEFTHGKLTRSFTMNDRLGLLQALGVVPKQVGSAAAKPSAP
jgi:predicted ester cyclase